MYSLIDWMCSIGSISLAIWLPKHYQDSTYCLYGIGLYLLYPLITDSSYNIIASLNFSDDKIRNHINTVKSHKGHPIVYNENYNITACGLEKYHPFDSTKYQRIVQQLIQSQILTVNKLFKPEICSRGLMLSLGVSKIYLLALCYSVKVSKVIEIPLFFLPSVVLRTLILNPMLYCTQGSIDAAILSIEKGWAINIGGGYHHAHLNGGGGFCVYPDITLNIKFVKKYYGIQKVMIIDLDAHQGNGHEKDFMGDQNTFIIDFYNHFIYPGDESAAQAIADDVYVDVDSDAQYMTKLKNSLKNSFEQFQPEYVLYNAGTDCMKNDPLGKMYLSANLIIARDQYVLEFFVSRKIPIVMVLSGGYQEINAPTIADSIQTFLDNQK